MSSFGCGKISKISDPLKQQYLIHHFYPDEPDPENELTDEQKECLSKWANKFHVTHLSVIKKDPKKTDLLKKLLHIGMEKIKNHIQPVSPYYLKNTVRYHDKQNNVSGFDDRLLRQKMEPVKISTLEDYTSLESGISDSNMEEPTVEEVLLNPFIYIEWQISQGRLKGGSTRRKKSRGRKTRKYL